MNHHRRLIVLALMIAVSFSRTGPAADPAPPQGEPAAVQLLGEVGRAYRTLAAYADQGEQIVKVSVDGKSEMLKAPVRFAFVRPNKLAVESALARVVSDGKTLTTSVVPFKKYESGPAPKTITVETLQEGPLGSVLFGGPHGRPMTVLASLLFGDDPAKAIAREFGGTFKLDADRDLDGTKCRTLRIVQENGADALLLIDPATKLLRGIDVVVDPKALSEDLPPARKVALEQFGWRSGKVETGPPPPETFAVEPPRGFAKVVPYTAEPAEAEAKRKVEERVGKPAPDFTLSVLDGSGKVKNMTKADLAGKVVVIDFWATWCPPCLAELPEIQQLVEGYGKGDPDVVIVALSEDKRPSEIGEVRKLVEKTLDQKKIKLTGNAVGKIALDPSGTVGEAFEVEALPTIVVLDAKGIVRSAHVGFSPDVREVLGKEIDALLKGEPLPIPKARD